MARIDKERIQLGRTYTMEVLLIALNIPCTSIYNTITCSITSNDLSYRLATMSDELQYIYGKTKELNELFNSI